MTTEEWKTKLPCLVTNLDGGYNVIREVHGNRAFVVDEGDQYWFFLEQLNFICTMADLHKHMTKLYPEAYL